MDQNAGCGCQIDAGGQVFVDHCVCPPPPERDLPAALDAARARVVELEAEVGRQRREDDEFRAWVAGFPAVENLGSVPPETDR